MRFIEVSKEAKEQQVFSREWANLLGKQVILEGYIQSLRELGGVTFLLLRSSRGFIQAVLEGQHQYGALKAESAVRLKGKVQRELRAAQGYEVHVEALEILASPSREGPASLGKKKLNLSLEAALEHRTYSLRHASNYHRFRLQAALAQGFRQSMQTAGFTEIFTPKLVAGCAEGGANMFSLDYFGKEAYLTQSPQLYKQIMVGIYGRVFEVGHVYRAEKHNSSRHLNEYVSLDYELGFIGALEELLELHVEVISGMFEFCAGHCPESISALAVRMPEVGSIPVLHLQEALALIHSCCGVNLGSCGSLSAQGERLFSEAVKKEYGSELAFVTHYHSAERPFYAKESAAEPKETESFDLIFRGMEITTGGLRINEHQALCAKMTRCGLNLEPFKEYLSAFEYGLPPHGGSGTGLERVTMLLAGEANIRQAALFPRDMNRLTP